MKLGLFHEKMSADRRPFTRPQTSASERGSLKKSLSSIATPLRERNALVFRQVDHLPHQYRVTLSATHASLRFATEAQRHRDVI